MSINNENVVFATSGQGTWTSGTTEAMLARGLEIICSVDDPEWTIKVGKRTGLKISEPKVNASGDAAVKVEPLF